MIPEPVEYDNVIIGMSQPVKSKRKYKQVQYWTEPTSRVIYGYGATAAPRPVVQGRRGLEVASPEVEKVYQDEESGILVWNVVKFENWIKGLKS